MKMTAITCSSAATPRFGCALRTPSHTALADGPSLRRKSKYSGEDDSRADFLNVVSSLDERQRAWLHEALSTLYGTHAWLSNGV